MIGTELLHYQIEARLGAGGMGEVYQARDSKLGRRVAVKVLPELFAQDSERIARFEREARLLASLNHANIAALYGFERSNATHFLVMELVEGDTLSQRIARGPVPVQEALRIACEIAEALEAAHDKGVIHRDLKPANVKITPEGKVKVLDFGLAKALEAEAQTTDAMNSPTLSRMATGAGVILGTAGYMAPEQARGRAADQRSDIFSFGCLLYEMLTGRQTFEGETVTDIIASVLKQEADLSLIPANVHPRVLDLLRRCLAKDAKRRWHAVADVRVEIETILSESEGLKPAGAVVIERGPLWKRVLPFAATALLAAGIAGAVAWNVREPASATVVRFPFVFPEGQNITRAGRHVVAVSPDGQNIVYQANRQLFLRKIFDVEARPIEGTDVDAAMPFFSPDGQWIAFYSVAEQKLKKVAISGGAAVTIADVGFPFGASWTEDNEILLALGGGILRVSANGGKADTIIAGKQGETVHGPQMLPDSDHVLFTIATAPVGDRDRWDKAQIVVQSLKTGERKLVLDGGSDARYVRTGHLVYALGTIVLAIPFDVSSRAVKGGPVPLIEDVGRAEGASGAAHFSFSNNGTLAYIVGDEATGNVMQPVFADHSAKPQPLMIPSGQYLEPRISPNGKQFVMLKRDDQVNGLSIWIYDFSGTVAPRRLTFESSDVPVWSQDGQRIIFQSLKSDTAGALMWQRADGTGIAELLAKPDRPGSRFAPNSVSPDGKTLLFAGPGAGADIWSLSLSGDPKPKPLFSLPTTQRQAAFSPDGKWIAYSSNETGRFEIWVQPFPPTGAKYQITSNNPAGNQAGSPRWSPDGKQLYYHEFGGNVPEQLASVDVKTQPSFSFANPTNIALSGLRGRAGGWQYDITPDGKRFLALVSPSGSSEEPAPRTQMIITLNWFEEIKQRVR